MSKHVKRVDLHVTLIFVKTLFTKSSPPALHCILQHYVVSTQPPTALTHSARPTLEKQIRIVRANTAKLIHHTSNVGIQLLLPSNAIMETNRNALQLSAKII
jgi:hypothetical protein